MANVLTVIQPYWYMDTWVFDDTSVGLEKEPFVQGVPEMIDYLVKDIPNARKGFILLFSSQLFAGYQVELTLVRQEDGGCLYKAKDYGAEAWLSPVLFRYFETTPKSIYVRAEPRRAKYDRIRELVALKDRIEKLEQLVGKLILENEALREGRER